MAFNASEERLWQWLFLSLLPGVGPAFWQRWLTQFPSPLRLLDSEHATVARNTLPQRAREAFDAWQQQDRRHPVMARLRQVATCMEREGIQLVTWEDPEYPPLLREIHSPPVVLYVRGDPGALMASQVALVGSRKASGDGLRTARKLAGDLAEREWVVTSGLALGVDGAAHEGALAAGGATVAVLGAGVDRIYPRQHQALACRILQSGCLVSEMPPGTAPKPGHFPRRNRIISGLCQGIVVIEAGLRSGSLITARLALEQGREVLAVPGSIHNPQVQGCHRLLREGARLVETADDVLEELSCGFALTAPAFSAGAQMSLSEAAEPSLAGDEAEVYRALGFAPSNSDELASRTGLPADRMMQALLLLEMEGHVELTEGGYRRAGV
ncbi:DNA-processing protein DprA [Marinobacteraceae bacterium S3BR75-40.1]